MGEYIEWEGGSCTIFPLSLRNVALPPKCKEKGLFPYGVKGDLRRAFPSSSSSCISRALKQRFDGLPIHELCYYQSYHPVEDVLLDLERAIDPGAQHYTTGTVMDCLGMTPLHILACSTRHDLRLYQLLIEKCPDNLITRDSWGETPLLYAFWSLAPAEVLQLLSESHKRLFPNHAVNWVSMVETLSKADAQTHQGHKRSDRKFPLMCIQRLLEIQQASAPNQDNNWQEVLAKWAKEDAGKLKKDMSHRYISTDVFKCILNFDISKRLDSLGVEQWREKVESAIKRLRGPIADREKHINLVYEFTSNSSS